MLSNVSLWSLSSSLLEDKSLIFLFPHSNYECNTDSTGWPWFSSDQCAWAVPSTVQYIYQTSTIGGSWETLTGTGGGQVAVNALGIVIRYKQDDLAPKTSTLSASMTSSGSSDSGKTSPGPIPSSGLGTGAKAGIAIGAVVAALTFLGLLMFYARRRRRVRAAKYVTGERNQPGMDYHGEFQNNHTPSPQAELESPAKNLSERKSYIRPTNNGQAELYSGHSPTELE